MRALAVGLVVCALGGCASQTVSIRTVPDQTPEADKAAAQASAAAFAEAAADSANEATPDLGNARSAGEAQEAEKQNEAGDAHAVAPPVTAADAPPMRTYDPWGRLNRFTYRFNARFDEAIFLPVADLYRRAPSPLRSGVHNFFSNLTEIPSVINYTLQGRIKYGVRSLERLVINSTIGIGGLFDVATKIKLPGTRTGFATTLAKWGMHPGPYLVIPLLGPSTLRGGAGYLADYGTDYGINIFGLYRGNVSWGLGVANAVDTRANVNFRYYSTGSPFEYETIRFLYVHKILIEDEGLHAKDPNRASQAGEPAGK